MTSSLTLIESQRQTSFDHIRLKAGFAPHPSQPHLTGCQKTMSVAHPRVGCARAIADAISWTTEDELAFFISAQVMLQSLAQLIKSSVQGSKDKGLIALG